MLGDLFVDCSLSVWILLVWGIDLCWKLYSIDFDIVIM